MKFKPEHHIVGKVYDLTQENMNIIIVAFEEQKKENTRLREVLGFYADARSIRSSDPYCCVWEGWSYSGYNKIPVEIGTKAREALKGG